MKRIDIKIGDKYGRLEIIEIPFSKRDNAGSMRRHVMCKCICGNKKIFLVNKLLTKHTTSCGCLHQEIIKLIGLKVKTHGMSNHRIHHIWAMMKQRCFNKKSNIYKYYGGRGVTVCDDWLVFENFLRDMFPTYKNNLSLDRIDNNGNYEPSNCRWATRRIQALNTSRSKKYFINNKHLSLTEISELYNIKYSTLSNRIHRQKLSINEAINYAS